MLKNLNYYFFLEKIIYLNPYINNYNSFELDLKISQVINVNILFSKFGLINNK